MRSEGLNMLGLDIYGSDSAQEPSADKEANVTSDDFSANGTKYKLGKGSTQGVLCSHGSGTGV